MDTTRCIVYSSFFFFFLEYLYFLISGACNVFSVFQFNLEKFNLREQQCYDNVSKGGRRTDVSAGRV